MPRRARLILAIAVPVVLVVGGAAVAVPVLQATVLSPEAAVQSYADLIAEGRFAEARQVVDPPGSGDDEDLLAAVSLDAADRIVIEDVRQIEGANHEVLVSYVLDGEREVESLFVDRNPGFLGLGGWHPSTALAGGVRFVSETSDTVTVNGATVPLQPSGGAYVLFPGVYEVECGGTTQKLVVEGGGPSVEFPVC